MSKLVIAISGWKRSGKDTAAGHLINKYGALRFGFADTLKNMVSEQYSIPRDFCDNPDFKESPLPEYPVSSKDSFTSTLHNLLIKEFKPLNDTLHWTPRAFCILEGSVKRATNPDYWVNKVIRNILSSDVNIFVISDLRYKSEIETLKKEFGSNLITLRLNRFDSVDSIDPSEIDLNDYVGFDFVIENKSTVDNLYEKIDKCLKNYL